MEISASLPPGLLAHLRSARKLSTGERKWRSVHNVMVYSSSQYEWTHVEISASCYGPLLISVWLGAGLLFRSQTWGDRASIPLADLGGARCRLGIRFGGTKVVAVK